MPRLTDSAPVGFKKKSGDGPLRHPTHTINKPALLSTVIF
jgi:hypothetical protein